MTDTNKATTTIWRKLNCASRRDLPPPHTQKAIVNTPRKIQRDMASKETRIECH